MSPAAAVGELSTHPRLDSAAYNLTISGCRGQAAARRRLVKCQQTLVPIKIMIIVTEALRRKKRILSGV